MTDYSMIYIDATINRAAWQLHQANLCFYHGTADAHEEAIHLLAYVLKINLLEQCLYAKGTISVAEMQQFDKLLMRRIEEQIPLPYLTKQVYFANRRLYVDQRVMIPTSPIAEAIQQHFSPWLSFPPLNILDLCTGSGALAISMADAFPNAAIQASDISPTALAVANYNIETQQLGEAITTKVSDLFSNISDKFDLIVSNPPYVALEHYRELPKEFTHEPKQAFLSDNNGLHTPIAILEQSANYLSDKGILVMEVGDYSHALEEYYNNIPLTWIALHNGGQGVLIITKQELLKLTQEEN